MALPAAGRAFTYADGQLVELHSRGDRAGGLLLVASDEVSDRTRILAPSCDRGGVFRHGATLLTPVPAVPEPAWAGLLALGLGVPGGALRRRAAGPGSG